MIDTLLDGLTKPKLAIGEAAVAAEDRVIFWLKQNRLGQSLAAQHDADRLWASALSHIGTDGWDLDKRRSR